MRRVATVKPRNTGSCSYRWRRVVQRTGTVHVYQKVEVTLTAASKQANPYNPYTELEVDWRKSHQSVGCRSDHSGRGARQ
jgi:hypothetical protein